MYRKNELVPREQLLGAMSEENYAEGQARMVVA
jgi:hypothetical protein